MQLPPAGIEYATCPVSGGAPGTVYEVSFQDDSEVPVTATAWHTMTTAGDGLSAKVLLAGPDAETPGAAVVLPLGRHRVHVRQIGNPERIFRSGGVVVVGND